MFALNIYIWILIANAIFSWLYAFRRTSINTRNQFVNTIGRALLPDDGTGAAIRRFVPNLGGVTSPIVLVLIIYLVQQMRRVYYLYPLRRLSSASHALSGSPAVRAADADSVGRDKCMGPR